jgi:endonuclease YncB( thermonuclease family)
VRRILILFLALTLVLPISPTYANTTVASITDGDTIRLTNGQSVRLLQIDTPELNGNECYAKEAQVALANLLNIRGTFRLRTDPKIETRDAYGRLLRYLFKGRMNLNVEMVRIGAATPYFYKRVQGEYATQLMEAVQYAQANKLGLWSECPGTKLNPNSALTTIKAAPSQTTNPNQSNCDPNYEGCIPLFPPDLNCAEIKTLGLAPVKVIGKDVHRLDADGDGIGCTS